jgi:hypothetical protein
VEVSGQLHAPVALPTGKCPRNPLDRRLGGPESRSGHGGKEKDAIIVRDGLLVVLTPIIPIGS